MMKKIKEYIDACVPIIYVEGFNDNEAEDYLVHATGARKIWEWNRMWGHMNCKGDNGQGVERVHEVVDSSCSLEEFLVKGVREREFDRKIIIVKDVAPYMEDPDIVALFKNACLMIEEGELDAVFVFLSPTVKIPKELEKYMVILTEEYLSEAEVREQIEAFIEENRTGAVLKTTIDRMANALKGLSALEINMILTMEFSRAGELSEEALELVMEQKKQMVQKAGILEMVSVRESMDDIGGLDRLKEWIQSKAAVLKNMERAKAFGVELPKGVLIAGVPGCGKSLNAKASAKLLEVPLLKLDMGRLMGKYVGESEKNMRNAIALAEAIAPCVLWVDELEKAFAGINGGSGGAEVTTRLFGQFLTWMQEKESPVFVVATANDITGLPPELMRKGRFDEIFYVQLPKEEERKKIFEIHIKKRRKDDLKRIDIRKLVERTEGYSGADIEGVVKEAVEKAFISGCSGVSTQHILDAIQSTHSLKEIMGADIEKLEKKYEERKFKSAS